MQTDANVLLGLLAGDCCCPCGCDDPYHIPASTSDMPLLAFHPMMFGKKMRPIVITEDSVPFVPTIAVGATETPQRPEPENIPIMSTATAYDAQTRTATNPYSTGVLLEDATTPIFPALSQLGYINHQTRQIRTLDNPVRSTLTDNAPPGGYVNRADSDIAAIAVVHASAGPAAGTDGNTTTQLIFGSQAELDTFVTRMTPDVPGVGVCVLSRAYIGRIDSTTTTTVNFTRNFTAQETPGMTFSGATITNPVDTSSASGSAQGVRYVFGVGLPAVLAGGNLDPTNTYYQTIATNDAPGYLAPSSGPYTLVSMPNYAPLGQEVTALARTMTVTFQGKTPGGVALTSRTVAVVGIVAVLGRNNYISTTSTATTGTFVRNGTTYNYSTASAVGALWVNPPYLTSDPRRAPPLAYFTSPVINGKSFTVQTRNNPAPWPVFDTTFCDLTYPMDIYINGVLFSGNYLYWTAFSSSAGLTLVIADSTNIYVIPGLDTTKTVTVTIARFLADLRQAGTPVMTGVNSFPGHYAFPDDRAYAYLTDHWISFGPWDAFRDATNAQWKAAGLKKPATRAKFEAGKLTTPPAPTPPAPTHGLALYDQFPLGGTAQAYYGYVPDPPSIWRDPKTRVGIFDNPSQVEVMVSGAWTPSAPGLAAVAKPWQPGQEDDSTSVTGLVRLTFLRAGRFVFMGRGKGSLSGITVDGAAPIQAKWLGLDSVPSASPADPKAFASFVIEVNVAAPSVWNLGGFNLSGLSGRFTG